MLSYETAREMYGQIKEKMIGQPEDFREFYEEFLELAVDYAKTRLSWSFMSTEQKRADDAGRSIKHDAFMAAFRAVCRNLGIEGIEDLMPERKSMGDFACYLALFLSLEQR